MASRLCRIVVLGLLIGCGDSAGPDVPVVASILITPGTDTLIAIGETRQFTAIVRDADGNEIPGKTVTWSSTAGTIASVDPATGLATALANGATQIQAAVDGVTGSAVLSVIQEVAAVSVAPGTSGLTSIGATQQFTAVARDANAVEVTGVRFLWISSDPSVATVDTNGLARARKSGQVTITAAARGVPGYAELTVTQTVMKVRFTIDPQLTVVAGEALSPALQLELQDLQGNLVTTSRDAVTLTLASTTSGATLLGTRTVNAVGGIATFSGLTLEKAGDWNILIATSPAVVGLGDTSVVFRVVPAAPARVVFATEPAVVAQGNVTMPDVAVRIEDRFGNTDTTSTVTLEAGSVPWPAPGTRLSGTLTASNTSGLATFTGLKIDKPGQGYTLRARAGSLSGESRAFDVALHFLTISAGGSHTCGITNGGTYCWGRNDYGQLGGPTNSLAGDSIPVLVQSPVPLSGVAAGGNHTCAVAQGTFVIHCWGLNHLGQLGIGSTENASTPTPVSGNLTAYGVATGLFYTCAVTPENTGYCWGDNAEGQLGTGGPSTENAPAPIAGGLSFSSVHAGIFHSCGLTTTSVAYCWGRNDWGQLGDSSRTNRATPVPVYNPIALTYNALALGTDHTCGRRSTIALCWGNNGNGQVGITRIVGDTTTWYKIIPTPVQGYISGTGIATIDAGNAHTCATTSFTSGAVYCWGANRYGQIGDGNAPNDADQGSTAVFGTRLYKTVSVGAFHSCAVASGLTPHAAYCWGGDGSSGLLGTGSSTSVDRPTRVVR